MPKGYSLIPSVLPCEIGTSAYAVLGVLSSQVDDSCVTRGLGIRSICERSGLSRSTVIRALKRLEERGCVRCDRASGSMNQYHIRFDLSPNWEGFVAMEAAAKHRCLSCGDAEVTIDHVFPSSRGGGDQVGNLQPLCHACNSTKGADYKDYRDKEFWDRLLVISPKTYDQARGLS